MPNKEPQNAEGKSKTTGRSRPFGRSVILLRFGVPCSSFVVSFPLTPALCPACGRQASREREPSFVPARGTNARPGPPSPFGLRRGKQDRPPATARAVAVPGCHTDARGKESTGEQAASATRRAGGGGGRTRRDQRGAAAQEPQADSVAFSACSAVSAFSASATRRMSRRIHRLKARSTGPITRKIGPKMR